MLIRVLLSASATACIWASVSVAQPGLQTQVFISEDREFSESATSDYRGAAESVFVHLVVGGHGVDAIASYKIPYRLTDFGGDVEPGLFVPNRQPLSLPDGSLVLGSWNVLVRSRSHTIRAT